MMRGTKRTIGLVVLAGLAIIVSGLASFVGPGIYLAYRGQHLRTRLLCETDHQAVLDACRELSKQVGSGALEAGSYSVRRKRAPEVAKFLEVIRALRPESVVIDRIDRHVKVVMLAGWDNFGMYAYPEDFTKRFEFEYRDRKLREGLWYYDEFYQGPGKENWDAQVDAMLSKNLSVKKGQP
jgi:hypothetical protein